MTQFSQTLSANSEFKQKYLPVSAASAFSLLTLAERHKLTARNYALCNACTCFLRRYLTPTLYVCSLASIFLRS